MRTDTVPNSTPAESEQAAEHIPLCVPEIRGREWEYVKDCLDSGWVSSAGAFVNRFEEAVAGRVGVRHAVATVNGTAALHIALLLAGVEPDDEVLVSDLTFIAPANAVRYAGAHPVFIDAEPEYWQMDPTKLGDFLTKECLVRDGRLVNRATGRRVRAVLPVDVLGHPCDLEPILELARRHDLPVVEDATEALGAEYRGVPVGRRADIACFSFNGNKIVTTGGGGTIVTDRAEWAERARHLTTQARQDPLEYIHDEVGYNYRLPNLLAAVGCAQMERLGTYVVRKRQIALRYSDALAGVPGIQTPREAVWARSNFWMYTVCIDAARYGVGSRALLKQLADRRIQSRPLWQPMHLSPAQAGSQAYRCEVSARLYRDALSLPCSVGLTEAQAERVIAVVAQLSCGR
jgi:perosamine synthetase